jgi:hypothetical protein
MFLPFSLQVLTSEFTLASTTACTPNALVIVFPDILSVAVLKEGETHLFIELEFGNSPYVRGTNRLDYIYTRVIK